MRRHSVLFVISDPYRLSGIQTVLARTPGLHMAGAVPTLPDALVASRGLTLDLLLLDLEDCSQLRPFAVLRWLVPSAHVGVLYDTLSARSVQTAVVAGVSLALPWSSPLDVLATSLSKAAQGDIVLHTTFRQEMDGVCESTSREGWEDEAASVRHRLREQVRGRSIRLTQREIDVIHLLAQALPNKAIASQLGITENTVTLHTSAILAKLGLSSRTAAAVAWNCAHCGEAR